MEFVKNIRNGLRTEISGSGYLESARNFDPNPMAMVPDPKIRIFGSKSKMLVFSSFLMPPLPVIVEFIAYSGAKTVD